MREIYEAPRGGESRQAEVSGRRRRALVRAGLSRRPAAAGRPPADGLLATTGELERLVELSVDMLCVTTMAGRFVVVNPAWSATLGWSEDELRGSRAIDFIHPDDRERLLASASRLAEPGAEVHDFEARFMHRDGSIRWLVWSARSDGSRLYAVARDMTSRKGAEQAARDAHEALRTSEQRLRKLVQTAHEGIWLIDTDDRVAFVNGRLAEMLGYRVEEILGRPIYDFLAEQGRALARTRLDGRRQGVSDSQELRLIRKDGGEVWVILSGSPLVDDQGRYVGTLDMLVEITDRRQREQALRASEERYRNIVETTSEGVWMIDADHRTTYVNRRMAEMLGYTVEEMLGRPVTDFTPPTGRPALDAAALRRRSGMAEQRETLYRRKDGSEMWALVSGSPLTAGNGRYGGALAMISDITERKRAEEAAVRLAAVVESAPDAIFSTDLDGRVTSFNAAAERLYGYARDEVIGMDVWELAAPEARARSAPIAEKLRRGGTIGAVRTRARHKDGTLFEVEPTMSAITAPDGGVTGTLAIVRPVSRS